MTDGKGFLKEDCKNCSRLKRLMKHGNQRNAGNFIRQWITEKEKSSYLGVTEKL